VDEEKFEPITKWAPVVGRWTTDGKILYRGQPSARPNARAYGICVSNVRFTEGKAEVTIRLPADPNCGNAVAQDASACLLFGYRSPDEEYFNVGLGEWSYAFTISRLEPGRAWLPIIHVGDKENLSAAHDYKLVATVQGQQIFS
jgi:hypothetical protein